MSVIRIKLNLNGNLSQTFHGFQLNRIAVFFLLNELTYNKLITYAEQPASVQSKSERI